MKGALATTVLMFTMVRLQRWLLWSGLIALATGALCILGAVRAWWPPVLLISGCALVLGLPVFLSGVLLRQLASPRALQLTPGARSQLLLGTLLTTLLVATGVALTAALLMTHVFSQPAHGGELYGRTALMFSATLLTTTLCCCCFYYSSRLRFGFLIPLVAFTGLRPLLPLAGQLRLLTPAAMLASSLGLWVVFTLAFLRARRIAPAVWGTTAQEPDLRFTGLRPRDAAGDPAPAFTRPQALRALLSGVYASGRASVVRLLLRVVMFYGGLLALIILVSPGHGTHGESGFLTSMLSFMGTAVVFAMAASMIRRARYLWLKAGLDRRQLFLTVEALCWRVMLGAAVILLVMAGLFCLLLGAPPQVLARAELLTLIPGAAILYLGLLCIQGWRLPDVLVGAVYTLLWLATFVLSMSATLNPALLYLLAVQALLIPVFRFWARARWDRIDWLRNMPRQALHRPVA